MFDHLKGKTALVTGSTSGIGKAIAEHLASLGCHVMLNGFGDQDTIETQRAALESKYGVKASYSDADMTDPDAIAAMISRARDELGGVDILVNNAGIQHVSPIDDFPREKWDAIIAINLSASFHTMQHAIPLMREAGWGRIINIASAHALVASPFKSAYVAAKHGIAGLTKTVALEVAKDNITCNAICPGYVWTPLVENQVADTAKARGISEDEVKRDVLLSAQPTKQFTEVEDIAAYVAFLCTEPAHNTTGGLLTVDGGWTSQ